MSQQMILTLPPATRTPGTGPRSRGRRRLTACAVAALALTVAGVAQAQAASTLSAGQTLSAGASLTSPDGRYTATLQASDGNFVVRGPAGPIWSSNTGGLGGNRLVMQTDGNLVEYTAGGTPVFATGWAGSGSANTLEMQNDGNLVEYTGARQPLWWSNSSRERAIQWFYNHRGWTGREGQCELAVEESFGTSKQYSTARANWNARVQQKPFDRAPRGALVFYSTSTAGHVAISMGNGTVFSTSAPGRKIDIVRIGYFQNPLGWAWAPW